MSHKWVTTKTKGFSNNIKLKFIQYTSTQTRSVTENSQHMSEKVKYNTLITSTINPKSPVEKPQTRITLERVDSLVTTPNE
ncbi:hypothetical protein GBA52_013177 [Prunus armeniaca]|nr:hypothetical protein GBA52_013177 [Prunus armeniaca]